MLTVERPVRQLPLSLPHRAEMTRADFLAGAANEAALAIVDGWPRWPEAGMLLVGPSGSGKSHLAAIWSARTGAPRISAADLRIADAEALVASGAVVVEDLRAGAFDEAALFHLLNLARERRAAVLATGAAHASALRPKLPDLASRLRAMQPADIAEPDEELLARLLTKLFADRQLTVEPAVVGYIVLRMERSLASANAVVAALDREALAEGRSITKPLAGRVLRQFDDQIDFWPEAR